MHYKSKDFILICGERVHFLSLRRYENFAYSDNDTIHTKSYGRIFDHEYEKWKKLTFNIKSEDDAVVCH